MAQPTFEHLGSLITYREHGTDQCLGHLMEFKGHGVYEPNLGKVDVSSEHAAAHNQALDQALIDGLSGCEVGQGGFFYFSPTHGTRSGQVTTFTGLLVSEDVTVRGQVITFRRDGKTYRGRLTKDADSFNFRRVS